MNDANDFPFFSIAGHLQTQILEKFEYKDAATFHQCSKAAKELYETEKSLKYPLEICARMREETFVFGRRNVEVNRDDLSQVIFRNGHFNIEAPLNDERCTFFINHSRDCTLSFFQKELLTCSPEVFNNLIKSANMTSMEWVGDLKYLLQYDVKNVKIGCGRLNPAPIKDILAFDVAALDIFTFDSCANIFKAVKVLLESGAKPREKTVSGYTFNAFNLKSVKKELFRCFGNACKKKPLTDDEPVRWTLGLDCSIKEAPKATRWTVFGGLLGEPLLEIAFLPDYHYNSIKIEPR